MAFSKPYPEIKRKIEETIDACENEGASRIMQQMNKLIQWLVENRVIIIMKINCRMVGICPQNRNGYGVNVADVYELMSEIRQLGWDPSQVHAFCVEVPPEDVATMVWNNEFCDKHKESLPPAHGIKFAAMAATHTNMLLRCIAYNMPHSDPTMTIDGKLSVSKIKETDELYAAAVDEGLFWHVIPYAIAKDFPRFLDLLQEMQNAPGQLFRGEHDFQLHRKINAAYKKDLAKVGGDHGQVDFARVKDQVCRTRPANSLCVPGMYEYQMKFGGGVDNFYIMDAERAVKAKRASSSQKMNVRMLEAMLPDVKGKEQGIRVRTAMLKLYYLSSAEVCFGPNDVKKVLSGDMKPKCLHADSLIHKVRSMPQADIENNDILNLVTDFECTIVCCLMDRKIGIYDKAHSLNTAAYEFVEALNGLLDEKIANEWEAFAPPASAKEKMKTIAAAQQVQMRTFECTDGSIKDALNVLCNQSGFKVGDVIQNKKEKKVVCKITSISATAISATTMDDAAQFKEIDVCSIQSGDWKHYDVKDPDKIVDAWESKSAMYNFDFKLAWVKARILSEIASFAEKFEVAEGKLTVCEKQLELDYFCKSMFKHCF